MASPRHAARHQQTPDQQSGRERVIPFPAQTRSEPTPFVITSAQILAMAECCLSAQQITDALEREGPIQPGEFRHEK